MSVRQVGPGQGSVRQVGLGQVDSGQVGPQMTGLRGKGNGEAYNCHPSFILLWFEANCFSKPGVYS